MIQKCRLNNASNYYSKEYLCDQVSMQLPYGSLYIAQEFAVGLVCSTIFNN